jgi:flagellin
MAALCCRPPGALDQVSSSLQQLNDLAVQAGNGTLGQRSSGPAGQASQLTQNLNQIAGNTQFNGQNLLDGSFSASLQTGPNAGDSRSVSLGSVSASALGVGSLDLSSSAGQASALQAISQAMQQVSDQQAGVGATQAGLQANFDQLAAQSGRWPRPAPAWAMPTWPRRHPPSRRSSCSRRWPRACSRFTSRCRRTR